MKISAYNWNCVLSDIIPELEKRHKLVDPKDADRIVVWSESFRYGWGDRIKKVQKRGGKSIVYQQGVWGMDWVRPPFSEPIISDVVCVWGEGDKEKLIKFGTPAEKIKVTGSPILKHLIPRVEHEGKNVVFALEHWDMEDCVENLIVASELRKLEGVKVITKGVFRENQTSLFQNPVESDRFGGDHLKVVAEVLSTADLVVGLSESTFQMLAESLDIPVVIADIWKPKERGNDPKYLDFKGNFSNGVTKVKLEDLNKTIKWQLKHPEIKREERKEAARLQLGVGINDPTGNLLKIIEDDLSDSTRDTKPKADYQAVARRRNIRSGCVLRRNCKNNI